MSFDLLVASRDYKGLSFKNQTAAECRGKNETSERDTGLRVAAFETSLTECGTVLQDETDDEHVYTNKISNIAHLQGQISREYKVVIPITCSYNRTVRVSQEWYELEDYTIDTDLRDEGEYRLDLKFYDGADYNNEVTGFPMVVHLNGELYFQASSEYSHLDLSIKSCWAALGSDLDEAESYEFIKDWEVIVEEEDITSVTCQDTPPIDAIQVETRAFRFLEGDADQVIYIHCDLFVCDKDDANSMCKDACIAGYTSQSWNRRRREAGYAQPPLPVQRVTRGPIRIVRDTQSNQVESEHYDDATAWTSPMWVLAVLAMSAVVILLLAALVVLLRKGGLSLGGGKTDEEEGVDLIGK
ncbi:ZP domain-containing protein-like [Diadema antillarum]|uniref:ZP domain-containing protein-like n=1 Tax=Diadema antillarum TaxID=105358 RepID=UPI003A89ECF0